MDRLPCSLVPATEAEMLNFELALSIVRLRDALVHLYQAIEAAIALVKVDESHVVAPKAKVTFICTLSMANVTDTVRAVVCMHLHFHAKVAVEPKLWLAVVNRILILDHLLRVSNLAGSCCSSVPARLRGRFAEVAAIILEARLACVLALVPNDWIGVLLAFATLHGLLNPSSIASQALQANLLIVTLVGSELLVVLLAEEVAEHLNDLFWLEHIFGW